MLIIMSALIKATSADIPPEKAVFFRSFFALPVIFIWLLMRGNLRTGLRVISPIGHFWRGFAGTAAMGFFFKGLGLLPLPEVTAIRYAAPLQQWFLPQCFWVRLYGYFALLRWRLAWRG